MRSGRCELGGKEFLYVAMEYAEENLAQILPQRALTADEVREMLPPLLDALDYLHQNELVHGGLKPANVMAAGDQLKLSVDGVMRVGDAATAVGRYDAPEVQSGVSPASDVWSLGMTLVEVLTQHLPTWEPGAKLPVLPDNLPEQFRVIAQRCLLQDPNLRCKIPDIRERLNAPLAKPVPASASVAQPPAAMPVKSSTKKFAIPIAVAVVIIGAIVAIPRMSEQKPETDKPEIDKPSAATTSTPTLSPAASAPVSAPPTVMAEATEPPPAAQKAAPEPERPETIPVIVPQKEPATAPKPVATPAPVTPALAKPEPTAVVPTGKQGEVVRQVLPDVPTKAMHSINGKFRVQVKVNVDRDGNVVGSEFVSPGPSKYFATLTMAAAKEWKFSPSDATARAWNLQFEFRRSGASVVPVQVER